MSYSFSVEADNKADAYKRAVAELDKVVVGQPIHKADQAAAMGSVDAVLEVLGEAHELDKVALSVSGSVTWNGNPVDQDFIAVSISVSARILNRK